jgi:hypothetical protein
MTYGDIANAIKAILREEESKGPTYEIIDPRKEVKLRLSHSPMESFFSDTQI